MATKAVAKKEESALAPAGGGIEGIVGMTNEDVNMPYMYLVRSKSEHAVLKDGTQAKAGTYYHSVKKTAEAEMEVVIARAVKGEVKKGDDFGDEMVPAWKVLMLPAGNLTQPFGFTFKGMNLWYGWKPFLTELLTEGIPSVKSKVVKMTHRVVTTKNGKNFEVPVFTIVGDANEDQLNAASALASRFEGEDELDEPDGSEDVAPEEVKA